MPTEAPYSFAALQNRLQVSGTLIALTALRIGSGRSSDVSGSDLPVLRDARGRPFIPGASLKGALRARVEALISTVQPDEVRDLMAVEDWQRNEIAPLKEDERLNDRQRSAKIWRKSNLVELTFGAQWSAGRIFFKDALVDDELWFGQYEVRNGVSLDRDTETAADGRLYDYEVVPAGTRFGFDLLMENAAPWQLGMILLALQPWQRGEAQIGGFRSRGLGYVKLDPIHCRYCDIRSVDDVLALLETAAGAMPEAGAEQQTQWREKFVAVLRDPALAREGLDNA
jgi:CRISPR-associated RAMP protein (TIGR02581 family)